MKMNKVIVIGSGLSGHYTAMVLQNSMPHLDITIINDINTPTIGVGESGIPDLLRFLFEQIMIDVNEFYQEVKPVHKMGINFRDWVDVGFNYNYSFDSGMILDFFNIDDYQMNYTETAFGCYLINNNLTPLTNNNLIYSAFSYQIDNLKFVNFLKKMCIRRGIKYLSKKVIDVEFEKDEKIKNLIIDNDERLSADFFFDCTGFNSIIAKKSKTKFISFKDKLPCDYAIVGQHDIEIDEIKSYTVSTRKPAGWQWEIDTTERAGKGYVFCSEFMAEEKAIENFLKDNPKIKNTRTIPFPSGKYENICGENYLLNGNAQGFAEPLESTGFSATLLTINNFVKIIDNDGFLNTTKRKLLNNYVNNFWSYIVDFLVLHYKNNKVIEENGFWEYCDNELKISENMNFILSFIKENIVNKNIKNELMRYWPTDPIFNIDGILVHANARKILKKNNNLFEIDSVMTNFKRKSRMFLSEKNIINYGYNNINFENYISNRRYLNEFFK